MSIREEGAKPASPARSRLTKVRRALAAAPANTVVDSLTEVLRSAYAITDVELLLVDYRLATLVALLSEGQVSHPGDPAWRCFDHQSAVHDGATTYLPVTARGERLGVLRLTPTADQSLFRGTGQPGTGVHGDGIHGELAEVATLLGHELLAATASTDRYIVAARTRRLTLAAEMQWELLPGRSRNQPSFSLGGQLEPAYAVRGDTFDWAEQDDRLYLNVLNGMGDGVAAAQLTSLATHALRNARRGGLDLAGQASLADQAVFAEHKGALSVETLMLEFDLVTGTMLVVDAGSPRMLVLRGGEVIDERVEPQFPLGMFESSDYLTERFHLRTGDRVFVVSDGVFDAAAATGRYGDAALHRFIRRTESLAPLQAVRSLLGELRTFVGNELDDDAVAVCVDWTGTRS